MANITTYQVITVNDPVKATALPVGIKPFFNIYTYPLSLPDVVTRSNDWVNPINIQAPSRPISYILGINPIFSVNNIGSLTLSSAIPARTGLLLTVMDSVFGSLSTTVARANKLRGWHTVNMAYMYWSEKVVTPDGIDPTSIVIVGLI